MASNMKRYKNAVARGICGRCYKKPARPGKAQCQECNDARKRYAINNIIRYRGEGLESPIEEMIEDLRFDEKQSEFNETVAALDSTISSRL